MLEVLVVCEAPADFRIATDLADRVCQAHAPDWATDILLDLRTWRGVEPNSSFSIWSKIGELAKQQRVRVVGRRPNHSADYAQTRKALLLAHKLKIQVAILIRDADSQTENRRSGMEKAQQDSSQTLTVIIGLANSKREAWVLNGFEPCNKQEQQKFADLNKTVGFDVCCESHRLRTIRDEGSSKRHPKKVLDELTDGVYERECSCWQETSLEILLERGKQTGLSDYLEAIRTQFIPKVVSSN